MKINIYKKSCSTTLSRCYLDPEAKMCVCICVCVCVCVSPCLSVRPNSHMGKPAESWGGRVEGTARQGGASVFTSPIRRNTHRLMDSSGIIIYSARPLGFSR